MNSSKIVFPPSVLNVNKLKNMLVLWLAQIFHEEGKRQKQSRILNKGNSFFEISVPLNSFNLSVPPFLF